jgi:hypothetical protein
LTFRAGQFRSAELKDQGFLAHSVTFTDDIKPLLDANCVSCHPSYADYAGFKNDAAQAILDIENGSMPQAGPLADSDIATFLAWQDGGYHEADEAPPESDEAQKLGNIFYRNNDNDVLESYELLGRTYYELTRTLWIQPEGQAQGLTTKHVSLSQAPVEQE